MQNFAMLLKNMRPKAKSDDEIDAVAWLIKGGAYGSRKKIYRCNHCRQNNDYPKKSLKYAKIKASNSMYSFCFLSPRAIR